MANLNEERSLRKISEAFKDLSNTVSSQTLTLEHDRHDHPQLELASFSHACSLVSPLFRCLGIAFRFAEMDYVAKVDDLAEASKSIITLNAMVEQNVQANCVRKARSHTRNLLRVKRGLEMVRL